MQHVVQQRLAIILVSVGLFPFAATLVLAEDFSQQELELFEKQVRPLLLDHCVKCHGPERQQGGLNLATRESLVKGGDSGTPIVLGNREESLLVEAVGYQSEPKMPPAGKLPADKIEALRRWIQTGAAWTGSTSTTCTPRSCISWDSITNA